MRLNLEQKKSLSNYSGNLSIAWFAAGVIGPIVTKQDLDGLKGIMIISAILTVIFLLAMLSFTKERNNKRK